MPPTDLDFMYTKNTLLFGLLEWKLAQNIHCNTWIQFLIEMPTCNTTPKIKMRTSTLKLNTVDHQLDNTVIKCPIEEGIIHVGWLLGKKQIWPSWSNSGLNIAVIDQYMEIIIRVTCIILLYCHSLYTYIPYHSYKPAKLKIHVFSLCIHTCESVHIVPLYKTHMTNGSLPFKSVQNYLHVAFYRLAIYWKLME